MPIKKEEDARVLEKTLQGVIDVTDRKPEQCKDIKFTSSKCCNALVKNYKVKINMESCNTKKPE